MDEARPGQPVGERDPDLHPLLDGTWLHKDPSGEGMGVFSQACLWGGGASPRPAPTSGQHLGALAEAVVVVCVAGAEVGALQDQAALAPRRAAVPTQGKPGGHPEVVMGEGPRVRLGVVAEGVPLQLF